MKIALLK